MFAAHLTQSPCANTVKVYMAAVRSLHIEQGYPNPLEDRPRLERVIRGIKRLRNNPTRERLPVTIEVLRALRNHLCLTRLDDALFWEACCFGFFGLLRCGEFTVPATGQFDKHLHLCLNDVAVGNHARPTYPLAMIKSSKANPVRKGFAFRLGATGAEVCAVHAVTQFLHLRGSELGPLVMWKNKSPLPRSMFTSPLAWDWRPVYVFA